MPSNLLKAVALAAPLIAHYLEKCSAMATTVMVDTPSPAITLPRHTPLYRESDGGFDDTTCIPARYLDSTDRDILLAPVTTTLTATRTVWQTTTVRVRRPGSTVTVDRTLVPSGSELMAFTPPLQMIDGTTYVAKPGLTFTQTRHYPTHISRMTSTLTGISVPVIWDGNTLPITELPWTTVTDGQTWIFVPPGENDMTLDPSPVNSLIDPESNHTLSSFDLYENSPSCRLRHKEDRRRCHFYHCVRKHTQPINYTTIEFGQWFGRNGKADFGNVTHRTSIPSTPHWGVTRQDATYGPIVVYTTTDKKGWPTTRAMHNFTPLPCYDKSSCLHRCLNEDRHRNKLPLWLIIGAGISAGFLALVVLGALLRRFAKRDGRDNPKQPISRKGTAVPAGEVVEVAQANPATGTMGRRAEEGRGNVRFGQDAGDTTTTDAAPTVVTKGPNADHLEDARKGSVTGRDAAVETGSLRGRKTTIQNT